MTGICGPRAAAVCRVARLPKARISPSGSSAAVYSRVGRTLPDGARVRGPSDAIADRVVLVADLADLTYTAANPSNHTGVRLQSEKGCPAR